MFTRTLSVPGFAAAAALMGMFSQQVAATEEIVVYGAEAAALAEAQQALFQTQMDEYVRSLSEQIRTTLQDDVKRLAAPKVELASSESAIRG